MKKYYPQSLIHLSNGLGIQAQVSQQAIGRMLLVKALQNGNLARNLARLLLTAQQAFNVTTSDLCGLKRTTKTHSRTLKNGLTTKNHMSPNNHKHLQEYNGYETT
jgi:hypothetical protein